MTVHFLLSYLKLEKEFCFGLLYIFYFYVFVSMCTHVQVHVDAQRGQNRASDILELDLQAVVNCLQWVLETELWVCARTARTLVPQPSLQSQRECF